MISDANFSAGHSTVLAGPAVVWPGEHTAPAAAPAPQPAGRPVHRPPDYLEGVPYYCQTGLLGEGSFGRVLRAVDLRSTQQPLEVAIKLLPRGDFVKNYKTYVKREIVHQSSLKHPLIINLKEVFLTPTHLGIAMEYAAGGDLYQYLTRQRPEGHLCEEEARWLFQQLIVGLDYCHRRGVANRDLKLENLLLDHDGTSRPLLKICDFGYSKHEMNSSAKSGVGTAVYMAPEVILGESKYDAKRADIWSAGIIMYAMLFGQYPFDARDPRFARKVVTGAYTIPDRVPVSAGCRDLLTRMLVPNPQQRISLEDVIRHPWFAMGLPSGALGMNEMLLQAHIMTDELAYRVDQLVELALTVGYPGEPVVSLQL
ncbi:hypothetical protein N2152v2_005176 [Parachlorella kessleri]